MDLATLQLFVDVMRAGSFAAVARARNVATSSVSRAVGALEDEVGAAFFQRGTRRLVPTEAGQVFFERVVPLVRDLEQAREEAADQSGEPRGRLKVTAPVTFAQRTLVPLLPEFAARHPEVGFDLHLTDRKVDLVGEGFDLAVRLGRLADSALVAFRLCDMVYTCCASPAYLERAGTPNAPTDLADRECLRFPVPGVAPRWFFRQGDGEVEEVALRSRFVVTNGQALRELALAGLGVVMLPRWNVSDAIDDGRLVELLPDFEATASDFRIAAWVIYPSRRYLPMKVRAFADFLREKFEGGAPVGRSS